MSADLIFRIIGLAVFSIIGAYVGNGWSTTIRISKCSIQSVYHLGAFFGWC